MNDQAAARSHYIHGTSPPEQERLSLLNRLMNDAAIREIVPQSGERILDVGCGLGQLSRALARSVGNTGRVLGVERDPAQLERARQLASEAGEADLVEFRQGDACHLPLAKPEWESFDLAHTRFLLEHVPSPLDVVQQMERAVRPGGRVILQDDDHDIMRLWPEPSGFDSLWRAYCRLYDRLGNDPYVGRRLVTLLQQANLQPARSHWIFFGSCAGSDSFPAFVDNLVGVIHGAREQMVQQGLLPGESFDRAIEALRAWQSRNDAALWYAICFAEGVKPYPGVTS